MYSSLAVDEADRPHITCEANGALLYVWLDQAGAWQVETADEQGLVGRYSSLALDGDGLPHVSYYDATNADLKYAWRDQAGAWHTETVLTDTLRRVGRYSSLELTCPGGQCQGDALGRPHVSFYDETGGDLGYAWRDAGGWQVQTVATGGLGDVGWYSSLAVDGVGQVHVSYYDAGARDLRYARQALSQVNAYGWKVYLPLASRRD
jgi:hypothetical protein